MYFIKSIELNDKNNFIVSYSQFGFDSPHQAIITVNGDEFKEWYYDLDSVAWQSYDEMSNDDTGIFMYMHKYFVWLDEQEQNDEGDGRDEDVNDGNWSECPYDELRDLLQND